MPGHLWQIWEELEARQTDLGVQPTAGRRKAILLADMDSTIIGQGGVQAMRLALQQGPPQPAGMSKLSPFRYFRTSPDVIRLAVMMYQLFCEHSAP